MREYNKARKAFQTKDAWESILVGIMGLLGGMLFFLNNVYLQIFDALIIIIVGFAYVDNAIKKDEIIRKATNGRWKW